MATETVLVSTDGAGYVSAKLAIDFKGELGDFIKAIPVASHGVFKTKVQGKSFSCALAMVYRSASLTEPFPADKPVKYTGLLTWDKVKEQLRARPGGAAGDAGADLHYFVNLAPGTPAYGPAGSAAARSVFGIPADRVKIPASTYAMKVDEVLEGGECLCFRPIPETSTAPAHGMPAALASPAFLEFLRVYKEAAIEDEHWLLAARFCDTMSACYSSEEARRDKLLPMLKEILRSDAALFPSKHKQAKPDCFFIVDGMIPCVVEVKNEMVCKSEPLAEAVHYRTRFFSPDATIAKPGKAATALATSQRCPSLLVTLVGSFMSIYACWTDSTGGKQVPACELLAGGLQCARVPLRPEFTISVAAALRALQAAFNLLKKQAAGPGTGKGSPALGFQPHLTEFTLNDESILRLTYQAQVAEHSLYTAAGSAADGKELQLAVKFTEEFSGAKAHAAAAAAGFAPHLWHHEQVLSGMQVVICDWLGGDWKRLCDVAFLSERRLKKCRQAVRRAHRKGIMELGNVHGDLRACNIMVRRDEEVKYKWAVQFVDWDWGGVASSARYPLGRNPVLPWPEGSKGGGLILQEHDATMLDATLAQLVVEPQHIEAEPLSGKKRGRESNA